MMFRSSFGILLLFIAAVTISSCKKDDPGRPVRIQYEYFPVEKGHWVIYEVDSIFHDSALEDHDTNNYQLKEEITGTFTDNEGRKTYRLQRSIRDNSMDDWEIRDIWFMNRTETTAEKVEENKRIIKLAFPISPSNTWNGNAYNTDEEETYEYSDIHSPYNLNGETLDSTVKVIQKNNVNLIDREEAFEVYAKHIGLVRKKDVDLETYISGEIRKGTEIEWKMIDHR